MASSLAWLGPGGIGRRTRRHELRGMPEAARGNQAQGKGSMGPGKRPIRMGPALSEVDAGIYGEVEMSDERIDPNMTDDQFKVELLQALLYIGDGLHKIADAKITENELLAEDTGAEEALPQLDMAGRPIG